MTDWSRRYSPQDEIREYYDRVARYYNLHKSTAFGHTVLSAIWDDTTLLWNISVRNEAIGDVHYYTAPVVISAIGQLNRPKRARIPGADSFTGAQFHTAEWEHSDLTGKRVAIIGTGPSAGQIIPSIAPQVKSLHVYQRSPPHVLPRQDYEFSAMIKAIFRWVPFVLWFHHLYLYIAQEFMPYRSIHVPSKGNELATMAAKGHMESQIPPERQELRDRFRPNYAFGCKRPLFLDNYYPTFLRDNVTLTTVPPLQITKDSIITAEGEAKVDVIVWATGFLTQDMLGHIDIRGHQGISLRGQWGFVPIFPPSSYHANLLVNTPPPTSAPAPTTSPTSSSSTDPQPGCSGAVSCSCSKPSRSGTSRFANGSFLRLAEDDE